MGFFNSLRDLHKQASELENTMPPPGQRARDATARMADLTQSMAKQTQAINQSLTASGSGVQATAGIVSARTVGTVNFDPLIEFDLTVMRDGMPPYPATVQQAVSQMDVARLAAGTSVDVKVDPSDPSAVWIDPSSIR